ncbi:MAG: transglycosylase SLT domain-containing protein [Parvibaculaceae bacterium]
MKVIHALIPVALLAGTVHSGPVEARGTADAWLSISREDYFTVMSAKRLGPINKVRSLKANKKPAAARKATKKAFKKTDLTPRKKPAKLATANKRPRTAPVVISKPDETKPRGLVRLAPTPLVVVSKQNDIKPHEIARSEPVSVAVAEPDEIKPHEIARSEPVPVAIAEPDEITPHEIADSEPVPVAIAEPDEVKPHEIARSEPVSVAVAEPDDIKPNEIARSEPVSGAVAEPDEIKPHEIVRLESTSMSKVLRSGPREVENDSPGEALQISEADEVRIAEIIREVAPSYGVPTWFALRIAEVESNYDPYARGRAGEIGVYQLKCQTARGMGFKGDCSDLIDARTNVRWGLKHLSLAIALSGGNLQLAASKHNAGLSHKSLVRSYVAKVF